MRITISKGSILKSRILFFTIPAFILSVLLFTSCSESEGINDLENDTALIEKIESASKKAIDAANLPSITLPVLNGNLADTYIESAQLAEGLGFKVAVISDNVAFEAPGSDVYFSLEGKQLEDKRVKRRRRNKCFEFVFPIVLLMPDDSSITLNSKKDWSLKKDWYKANPDIKKRPELIFPVDISLEDGTIQTLIDTDDLRAIKDSCKKGKDKRKCFKLVLPVSFTMEDASVIEVTKRADFKLLREWKKANPDATVKPALNFPIEIKYRNQTTATIADLEVYLEAKKTCGD